jgi:hypothetical protein
MPDPLNELPYEMWTWCIGFASHDQPAGPLAFMMVSQNWQRELLRAPALWSHIWIQNDEDEMARIWTFLHLSGHLSLDLHITTVLPNTDILQLIKPHLSRVRAISIRPNMRHALTSLHGEQWKQAASNVMAAFSNRVTPSNAGVYSCSGRRIGIYPGVYHVALMQFLISHPEAKPASTEGQSQDDSLPGEQSLFFMWENYIDRCASVCLLYRPCRHVVIDHHKSIVSDATKRTVCAQTNSAYLPPHLVYRKCVLRLPGIYPEPLPFDICSMYVP